MASGTNQRRGPPLAVRTAYLLSRLGRAQASRFTEGLQPVGLRAKQFALLNQIALAEGSSQRDLGRRLGLDPSGLVASLDELARQGLVHRQPHAGDRRRYELHLTDRGKRKRTEGRTVAQRTELRAPLSEQESQTLHDLLARVAAGEPRATAEAAA